METKYLTIIPFLVLTLLSKEINSQNLQKKEFIKDLYKISNGFDKLKKMMKFKLSQNLEILLI